MPWKQPIPVKMSLKSLFIFTVSNLHALFCFLVSHISEIVWDVYTVIIDTHIVGAGVGSVSSIVWGVRCLFACKLNFLPTCYWSIILHNVISNPSSSIPGIPNNTGLFPGTTKNLYLTT